MTAASTAVTRKRVGRETVSLPQRAAAEGGEGRLSVADRHREEPRAGEADEGEHGDPTRRAVGHGCDERFIHFGG